MPRTGGIARRVDAAYCGLFIGVGADVRTGRPLFKFAAKLLSEWACHASARDHENGIDRGNAPVLKADPGEARRGSD